MGNTEPADASDLHMHRFPDGNAWTNRVNFTTLHLLSRPGLVELTSSVKWLSIASP